VADAHPGDSYTAGVRAALPLALVVGLFGASFGVLAHSARLSPAAALLMSATTFAGSAQFGAAAVLSQGGGVLAAIATVALLNARYIPMGASVARVLSPRPLLRLLQAQLVVDESWALAHQNGVPMGRRLVGAGVAVYIGWTAGTGAGLVGGSLLGDPGHLGLDAAFPALFLALVVNQLRGRRAIAAAVLGAGIAVSMVPFAPAGVPVLVAVMACGLGIRR